MGASVVLVEGIAVEVDDGESVVPVKVFSVDCITFTATSSEAKALSNAASTTARLYFSSVVHTKELEAIIVLE